MRHRMVDVLLRLREGQRIGAIAMELDRAESTIWTHVETAKPMFRTRSVEELRQRLQSMTPDEIIELIRQSSAMRADG